MPLAIPGIVRRNRSYESNPRMNNPLQGLFQSTRLPDTDNLFEGSRVGNVTQNVQNRQFTGAEGLGLDRDIERVTTRILEEQEKSNQFNIEQKNAAYNTLLGPGGLKTQVGDYYGAATVETEANIPLNPFSDALKQSLMTRVNDQITTESQAYLRQASEQLAARGLSSGGSTGQTAAGGVASAATRARTDTAVDLEKSQLEYNTASNTQRQGVLNELVNRRAALESQITEVGAGIQASNLRDPQAVADELGAAFGLQISRENQDELMQWIKDQEPNVIEKLLQGLPLIATALYPSAGAVTAGATTLANAFR